MTAMSRRKGQTGEGEVAKVISDLTGWKVSRKCRQHGGDDDLTGVDGWRVEVKRHARATRGDVRSWWEQSALQAAAEGLLPVLFWRQDRDEWRAVWPVALLLDAQFAQSWFTYARTAEGTVEAWAAVARNIYAHSCSGCSIRHASSEPSSDVGKIG
ncbi:hypothetical protein PQQ73_06285 [Paraburkholderia strydomiana]|uniref:Holliday junction resolvase n=1 Tax=Paraburkholderia strydomiana TaxID=1245417 RepID=A0ABW9E8K9_9BURK